jgi:ferredoxin, 2Fe-2S
MPTLDILNQRPPARVYVAPGQTLLAAIQAAGLDWMHACGARGRCTTCRLNLLGGAEHLAPYTAAEVRFRTMGRLPDASRLACQAQLLPNTPSTAELCGTVPPEGRLPHLAYT